MDRNAPISIFAALAVSIVGVFGLMTQPMVVGIYTDLLGFSLEQGGLIIVAEVAGGALASIMAMFWIGRLDWRIAAAFALVCVVVGNLITTTQTDPTVITALRFAVGFFGQGTAFAIGIAMIGSSSDPDRNFGFVIAAQVAFGVVALFTLRPLVENYQSIGGMYVPLAALAALDAVTGEIHSLGLGCVRAYGWRTAGPLCRLAGNRAGRHADLVLRSWRHVGIHRAHRRGRRP